MENLKRYKAFPDDCVSDDNPRDWGGFAPMVTYRASRNSPVDMTSDDDTLQKFLDAFHRYDNEHLAVVVANRWSRVFGDGSQVTLHNVTGYSQGDWWNVATTGTDSDVNVWSMWARGDVWRVREYAGTVCDQGETHWNLVDSLGGIYADNEESAIEQYREQN